MSLLEAGKLALLKMVTLREPLHHGNLRGTSVSLTSMGKLPIGYHPSGYVILSYDTPIGWQDSGNRNDWVVPEITYSSTTTGHQSNLKWAIGIASAGAYVVHGTMITLENHRNAFRRMAENRVPLPTQLAEKKHNRSVDEHDANCKRDGSGYLPGTASLCLACALMTVAK